MAHDSFARIEITSLCQTMLQLVSAGYWVVTGLSNRRGNEKRNVIDAFRINRLEVMPQCIYSPSQS